MISAEIGKDILVAKKILEGGGLVSIPTETVYGLAANALDENAVLKVFLAKNRPTFDPLIVHTHTIDEVSRWVSFIPEKARRLMEMYWPGALTILLKKSSKIPDLVTSGSPLVAIRIPNHPLTLKLLSTLDFPLAAPSANPFGYISPTTALHVKSQLGNKIEYILDGGPAEVGIESTIVGFDKDKLIVFRLGGISVENIENQVGKVEINLISNSKPSAPGMLTSHYAPRKPLIINDVAKALKNASPEEVTVIAFKKAKEGFPTENQFVLSSTEDLSEAARNLFSVLRAADEAQGRIILVESVPDKGLGRAINDRLKRAAATRKD